MTQAWKSVEGGDVVIVLAPAADLGDPSRRGRPAVPPRSARASLRALEHHEPRDGRRQVDRSVVCRAGLDRRRGGRGGGVIARRGRAAASALIVTALIAGLVGCSNDPLADQYRAGDNKGYIAGDFRVVEIAAADRGEPVEFDGSHRVRRGSVRARTSPARCSSSTSGTPPAGRAVPRRRSREGLLGFRGAGCLLPRHQHRRRRRRLLPRSPTRTESATPVSMAAQDGAVKLAFAERDPHQATPTTLVLDGEGRVAAPNHRAAAGRLDPDRARARRAGRDS